MRPHVDGDLTFFQTHRLSPEAERSRRIERVSRIVLDYLAQRPLADICREYDVHRSMVQRYVREAHVRDERRQKQRAATAARHSAILAAYSEGRPIAEIAQALAVSQALVSKLATEAGISRYRKPRAVADGVARIDSNDS